MSPIERAARALCKLEGHPENIKFEGKPMWQSYVPQALAVIHALHEPDQQMAEAGAELIRYIRPDEPLSSYQDDAANVWRMMMDAMPKDVS